MVLVSSCVVKEYLTAGDRAVVMGLVSICVVQNAVDPWLYMMLEIHAMYNAGDTYLYRMLPRMLEIHATEHAVSSGRAVVVVSLKRFVTPD